MVPDHSEFMPHCLEEDPCNRYPTLHANVTLSPQRIELVAMLPCSGETKLEQVVPTYIYSNDRGR